MSMLKNNGSQNYTQSMASHNSVRVSSLDRDAQEHMSAPLGGVLIKDTDHALCWKTCRGSVRKRVPN